MTRAQRQRREFRQSITHLTPQRQTELLEQKQQVAKRKYHRGVAT